MCCKIWMRLMDEITMLQQKNRDYLQRLSRLLDCTLITLWPQTYWASYQMNHHQHRLQVACTTRQSDYYDVDVSVFIRWSVRNLPCEWGLTSRNGVDFAWKGLLLSKALQKCNTNTSAFPTLVSLKPTKPSEITFKHSLDPYYLWHFLQIYSLHICYPSNIF